MKSILCITALVCVFQYFSAAETATEMDSAFIPELRRFARTYDKNYKFPKNNYGDTAEDNNDDDSYEPESSGNVKAYPQFSYPGYGQNYKGYPFYPAFKGPFRFPEVTQQSGLSTAPTNPWMSALGKIQDKKDEKGGFLSSLVSEPLVAAALVPLSVMLASFVPVLMNGFMGGMSSGTQVVTTTAANKKDARRLDGASYEYGKVMENFGKFSRAMENGDCFEKAICRTISGESREPGKESIKKAASFVASLVKYGWINNIDVKVIIEGLKDGNCDDLCNISKIYLARR